MLYMDPMGTYGSPLFGDELISQKKKSVNFSLPQSIVVSYAIFCSEFHHFEQEFQSSQQVSMTKI